MVWIILGLALWSGGHLFKRLAPARRAAMGDAGKGLVALVAVAGVVLMVVGYGGSAWLGIAGAAAVDLWYPPPFLRHVNNLLMVAAVYLFVASLMQVRITRPIRHPQLTAVKSWAVAHLLVNGDLASLVLFGGLLAWAVVSVILINRAGPRGPLPVPAPLGKEVTAVVVTAVVTWAIGWVHGWLGVPPWG
jgi:uncharacterized membrane protein